jgi:hypothetical protein
MPMTRAAAAARMKKALARVERELPPTVRQVTRRMRVLLRRLERELERAQTRYRGQLAKLLRDASNELERLESEGERTWTRIDARARTRILGLLRRLEKAVSQRPGPRAKKAARKAVRRAKRTLEGVASTVSPG